MKANEESKILLFYNITFLNKMNSRVGKQRRSSNRWRHLLLWVEDAFILKKYDEEKLPKLGVSI